MDEATDARRAARARRQAAFAAGRTGALATLDVGAPLTTLVGVASGLGRRAAVPDVELARHTKLSRRSRASRCC